MNKVASRIKKSLLLLLASSSLAVANDCCYTPRADCCYTSNVDCCDDSCGCLPIRVEVDYLLWQVRAPYDYVTTVTEDTDYEKSKYNVADYDFKSGARIGVFYDCLFPCLDVGVIWTTYYTSLTKSFDTDSNQHFAVDDVVDEANFKNQINFNYVDLDFSSKFCPLSCLSLRPHVGLRALWFNFENHTNYSGDLPESTDTLHITRYFKDEDRGIGLQGGLWAEWNLGCGFSLVGHFGGSVLVYQDKFNEKRTRVEQDSSGAELSSEIDAECSELRTSQQTFDYFLGVKYNTRLCNNDVYVQVGWEHVFLNFEYFQFQGLTAGIGTSF